MAMLFVDGLEPYSKLTTAQWDFDPSRSVVMKGRQVGKSAAVAQSSLDTVIRREVLPYAVADVIGASGFDSWTWHGFVNGKDAAVGMISARHIATGKHYERKFAVTRSLLDQFLASNSNVTHFVDTIDDYITRVVEEMVQLALPPHDPETCKDPECPC